MKKNGFSLVELLVVIVIVGVLSGVAILGVNKYFKTTRVKYYKSQEKLILGVGREYFNDNKNSLPREIGKSTKIQLSKLTSGEYIEDVYDYNKKKCDMANSYVKVKKENSSSYSYDVYLSCPTDNYSNIDSTKNKNSSIIINLDTSVKNNPKANVSITEENGLASYSYVIYRGSKEIKNSGNINNSSKSTTYSFSVLFKSLGDGVYTIKVTSIDQYGNETSKTSTGSVMIDTIGPKCGTITGASTSWSKTDRTLSITCSDDVSGCVKSSYSQVFSTTTKIGKITLTDKYGNTTKCSVNAYVDKDKPSCGDNNGSTSWTKNDRTVKLKCNDKGSGCEKNSYSTTFAKTTKVGSVTIYDKAGNSNSCNVNVYVDKTPPKCSTSTNHTSWTNQNVTLTGTCTDAESDCKEKSISKIFSSEGARTETPGTVYDKVGNSKQCDPAYVYIDKTKPSCTTTTTTSNWTASKVTITGKCDDKGGSNCKSSTISVSRDYEMNGSVSPGTVYDNAGNYATCDSKPVKIDRTAPSITSKSNSKNSSWTKDSVILSVSATDSKSGFQKVVYSYDKSSTYSDWNSISLSTSNSAVTVTSGTWKVQRNQEVFVKAYDNVGNATGWISLGFVRIDKTSPTCTTSGGSDSWVSSATIKGKCYDPWGSGCNGDASLTKSTDYNGSLSPGSVCDKAGNCTKCGGATVKIDGTKPKITNVKNSNSFWTNGTVDLSFDTSDTGGSGINTNKIYYSYDKYSLYTDWNSKTTSSTSGTWSAERNQRVYARVYDNAGNASNWADLGMVRIDKTPPTVSCVKASSYWQKNMNGEYVIDGDGLDGWTIWLADVQGSFSLNGDDCNCSDTGGSPYVYKHRYTNLYDKDGNELSGGCLNTRGDNPCTFNWSHYCTDTAGNSSGVCVNSYIVDY